MVLLRVFFIFFVLINFSFANDLLFYEKQSKIFIKELAVNLKKSLKAVMKESGPVSAVEYCNIAALDITINISNQNNVVIKRTSLKLRNKNNKPDKWEIDVLNNFEKKRKNGENIMSLSYYEVYKDRHL